MLDFLGVTEHFSCMENTPFSFPALFRDTTGEDVSLDGVIFSGSIMSANQEVVEISIEKGEASNEVILSFPALPEGRWSYNVLVQADDGAQRILFSGYISVLGISRVVQSAGYPPMKNRTLLVAMPGEAATRLRMEWMATTAAQAFAAHALQSFKAARTDAETASQAATTATSAATNATEHAKEAEGYAGAAYASRIEAGNSAASASTSAADAAHDARSANDAKAAVEGIVSDFTQTVSNGEQTISAAREEAVSAIQAKQADSVLAVGRAQKTATDKVASAQGAAVTAVETAKTEAVQAVQTAQAEAMEAITPLVEQAETAKEEVDQAEGRIKTAETNAETSATSAITAATAAQQALAAIPQVDAAGNMTLAGGLTTAGTHNANGGINIPLAAGAATDTTAVSRAYALGMVHTVMMHQARTYWLTSSCTATNGVTINHVVPGCYCEARLGVNQHTSLTMCTTGVVGGSNYSKNLGYSLPIRVSGAGVGYWTKVSMIIGSGGEWTEYPDAGRDDYRFRPVAGAAPDIARLVDVTIYYNDGYKARVRELIGIGNPRQYIVRTTESAINYNSNTGLASAAYRLVISQSELSYTDALAASVWLIIGGAAIDTVIKLADIRGWDTYHTSYAPTLYLDVQVGEYGGIIQMESPTILNGIGNNTYIRCGLEPYQRSWITSETEEPYTEPEQPAE